MEKRKVQKTNLSGMKKKRKGSVVIIAEDWVKMRWMHCGSFSQNSLLEKNGFNSSGKCLSTNYVD